MLALIAQIFKKITQIPDGDFICVICFLIGVIIIIFS
jgi:hypothetical protein